MEKKRNKKRIKESIKIISNNLFKLWNDFKKIKKNVGF